MYSSLELITGPESAIVTAAELKTFAKLNSDPDISVISSATNIAEQWCNRKFIKQLWRMTIYDQPPVIKLPYGYINSVSSIKAYDESGTATTESSSNYAVKTGENGHVLLKSTATWTSLSYFWYMQVDFYVGYDEIADMPEPGQENLKTAVLNIAAVLYYNRNVQIKLNERPDIMALLQPLRIYQL